MKTFNMQSAKTHLSRLVEEAVAGTEIILAKAGKPMVRLTPIQPDSSPRKPGAWKGKVRMAKDFNAEDGQSGSPTPPPFGICPPCSRVHN